MTTLDSLKAELEKRQAEEKEALRQYQAVKAETDARLALAQGNWQEAIFQLQQAISAVRDAEDLN